MKKILSYALLLLMLVVTACQEEEFVNEGGQDEVITANSEMAGYLKANSVNHGTQDDFIDGMSSVSIKFPYQVIYAGTTYTITSPQELIALRELYFLAGNLEPIKLVFPIVLRFNDYSEITINSEDDLIEFINKEHADSEEEFNDRIRCFQIQFPVTLLTFNTNLEQTGSVAVSSNQELFAFFNLLPSSIIVKIQFPISVKYRNGETVAVESLLQLRSLMKECKENWQSDDSMDDDLEGEWLEQAQRLRQNLLSRDWYVNKLMKDGVVKTEYMSSFKFQFFIGGAVKVTVNDHMTIGKWRIEYEDDDNGGIELKLRFNDEIWVLNHIDGDWGVSVIGESKIEMNEDEGNILHLSTTPLEGGNNQQFPSLNQVLTTLKSGAWKIGSYKDEGEDFTSGFTGFQLQFTNLTNVSITNGETTFQGNWSAQSLFTTMSITMEFYTDHEFVVLLNEQWVVAEYSETAIVLQEYDDEGISGPRIVLQRI